MQALIAAHICEDARRYEALWTPRSEKIMEKRRYSLMRDGMGWAFDGPNETSQTYLSKQAAFEGVVVAIRRDLGQGWPIELQIIQGSEPDHSDAEQNRGRFSVALC